MSELEMGGYAVLLERVKSEVQSAGREPRLRSTENWWSCTGGSVG